MSMKAMSRLMMFVLALRGVTFAEETPSPALLVVNKGHRGSTSPSELAIVDPGSGRVVARIPTGLESHEVAASPDGKLAAVTNTGPHSNPGHTLSIIDLAAQKEVQRVELGPLPNPDGIAWHDGKFYFTAEGTKLIARYDPAKNSVDWMMGVGQNSIHMLDSARTARRSTPRIAARRRSGWSRRRPPADRVDAARPVRVAVSVAVPVMARGVKGGGARIRVKAPTLRKAPAVAVQVDRAAVSAGTVRRSSP
jgi:hypothetical protein